MSLHSLFGSPVLTSSTFSPDYRAAQVSKKPRQLSGKVASVSPACRHPLANVSNTSLEDKDNSPALIGTPRATRTGNVDVTQASKDTVLYGSTFPSTNGKAIRTASSTWSREGPDFDITDPIVREQLAVLRSFDAAEESEADDGATVAVMQKLEEMRGHCLRPESFDAGNQLRLESNSPDKQTDSAAAPPLDAMWDLWKADSDDFDEDISDEDISEEIADARYAAIVEAVTADQGTSGMPSTDQVVDAVWSMWDGKQERETPITHAESIKPEVASISDASPVGMLSIVAYILLASGLLFLLVFPALREQRVQESPPVFELPGMAEALYPSNTSISLSSSPPIHATMHLLAAPAAANCVKKSGFKRGLQAAGAKLARVKNGLREVFQRHASSPKSVALE